VTADGVLDPDEARVLLDLARRTRPRPAHELALVMELTLAVAELAGHDFSRPFSLPMELTPDGTRSQQRQASTRKSHALQKSVGRLRRAFVEYWFASTCNSLGNFRGSKPAATRASHLLRSKFRSREPGSAGRFSGASWASGGRAASRFSGRAFAA